ncbi:hypothetical protein NE556_00740 [[Clostridium] symbiosum]|nr:hypothetical protein [[Clostridium] symbiosum]MCQ4833733.1 hypothetical protein [[Clostridium] symbiosum]MDB1971939.1 hypothetical protein [[Clostridium] symbiosum]MDB2014646.1 hypothetical protein [[Clostridium] symbiosum]MDB2018236.1 hypothetical protein [[Clostridium] symbiosum]MDB2020784.1 hypothetical protein [[Clostridium] symbiosum]
MNSSYIKCVMNCMKVNTNYVRNIRKYVFIVPFISLNNA